MTFKEGWNIFWNAQPANVEKINETNKEYLTKPAHEVGRDAPTSAATVPDTSLPGVDALYRENQEWAEEQAQKQMDYQSSANKIAMDYASAEAEKERAFEAEMSNSAYQRAVADLKKAGLNPILAYSQGGASVPSVSSPAGITSAGAKATTSDTGYTKYQLDYAQLKLLVNSATQIAGDLLSLAKK